MDLADITIEFTSEIAGVKISTNAENFSKTETELLKTYNETAFYWGKVLGSLLVTAIGTGTGIGAGAAAIGSAAGGSAAAPVSGGTTVALGSVVSVEAAGVSALGWTTAFQAAAALGDNIVAAIQKSAQGGGSNQGNSDSNSSQRLDDILEGAKPGRVTKGKTTQYVKPGSYEQTSNDFDALNPTNVKEINTKFGQGKTGTLSDGRTITARPGSSDGRPTLEIRSPNGRGIEIRYGE